MSDDKKPKRSIQIVADSEEKAEEWLKEESSEPIQMPPPIAQDFTDNPFSFSDPVQVEMPGPIIPDREKKEDWIKKSMKKLGLESDNFKLGGELSEEKIKFTEDGSRVVANIAASILGIMFSLAGPEYELLAPSQELAYKIVLPAARVFARHSKVVSEISPDYLDISECLVAVSEYIRGVFDGIREIRELKANGYIFQKQTQYPTEMGQEQAGRNGPSGSGRDYTGRRADEGQNGAGRVSSGPDDIPGPTAVPDANIERMEAAGLPSPSLTTTLRQTNSTSMRCFVNLLKRTASIGCDGQVSFEEFAEEFTDELSRFKEVYAVSKNRR